MKHVHECAQTPTVENVSVLPKHIFCHNSLRYGPIPGIIGGLSSYRPAGGFETARGLQIPKGTLKVVDPKFVIRLTTLPDYPLLSMLASEYMHLFGRCPFIAGAS